MADTAILTREIALIRQEIAQMEKENGTKWQFHNKERDLRNKLIVSEVCSKIDESTNNLKADISERFNGLNCAVHAEKITGVERMINNFRKVAITLVIFIVTTIIGGFLKIVFFP